MKILIAVKRVVDYNVRVRAKSDGSGVDIAGVKMSMNPFDEIAVEEAVKLKEAGTATELVAVAVGSKDSQEQLRSAMAMGVDRAILVNVDGPLESLGAAKILKSVVEKESPDLVIMGKQAIDDDANQTGQMLAALLDWPQGTFTSELKLDGGAAEATREIDGGLVTQKLTLPAVITTDLRLNEPRYPALPNIMKARSKPLEEMNAADLGLDIAPRTEQLSVAEPPKRSGGVKVASVEELVDKLKNEAKVI